MIRAQFYFPEDLYQELKTLARKKGKPVADIVRSLVSDSLRTRKGRNPAKVFAKIASFAGKGPRDLSENLDEYLYGKKSLKYGSRSR